MYKDLHLLCTQLLCVFPIALVLWFLTSYGNFVKNWMIVSASPAATAVGTTSGHSATMRDCKCSFRPLSIGIPSGRRYNHIQCTCVISDNVESSMKLFNTMNSQLACLLTHHSSHDSTEFIHMVIQNKYYYVTSHS